MEGRLTAERAREDLQILGRVNTGSRMSIGYTPYVSSKSFKRA